MGRIASFNVSEEFSELHIKDKFYWSEKIEIAASHKKYYI